MYDLPDLDNAGVTYVLDADAIERGRHRGPSQTDRQGIGLNRPRVRKCALGAAQEGIPSFMIGSRRQPPFLLRYSVIKKGR